MNDIFSGNKQPARVKARSLFCYWASGALGVSYAALAGRIGISAPGVGYSAERGKLIAQENGYQLLEDIESILGASPRAIQEET